MKDKEAAEGKVATLEADNTELSKRLVEMKMTEIERINEVNRICDEMMRNAQSMERAAAAEASSRSRQVLGKLFGTPGSSSDARVRATFHASALDSVTKMRMVRDKVGRAGCRKQGAYVWVVIGDALQAGGAANPALMDQLKGLTMQGRGIESRVPRGEARTVMSHEGGCYALAFDRCAGCLQFIAGRTVLCAGLMTHTMAFQTWATEDELKGYPNVAACTAIPGTKLA